MFATGQLLYRMIGKELLQLILVICHMLAAYQELSTHSQNPSAFFQQALEITGVVQNLAGIDYIGNGIGQRNRLAKTIEHFYRHIVCKSSYGSSAHFAGVRLKGVYQPGS
jgi:hypothetical protein